MHFARFNSDLSLKPDQVQNLLTTLIVSPQSYRPIHPVDSNRDIPQREAPDAVVAMCNAGSQDSAADTNRDPSIPPTPPISDLQDLKDLKMSAEEKHDLLMLQELVRRRLLHDDSTKVDSEM